MRFAADGPSIPNELIEARDRGEVIFFCGAGVSVPAGLPSFYNLTQQILTDLGVPEEALSRRIIKRAFEEQDPDLKPPMDQVIAALQREYGNLRVERSVHKQLTAAKNPDLSFHKTLLTLSRDSSGKCRLVTTNFDRLFEKAKPRIKYHVPPFIPDIAAGRGIDGIVYLHGRLNVNASSPTSNNLILGAGDYGRAYLAEGWALNFLRDLFSRYTVVLVGYSADDPPVNYLLRGLKAIDKPRQRRIYAFSAGLTGEADVRWWDRGVQVITYAQHGFDHSALWNTLSAWAKRAENPAAWRDVLITKAKAVGPANLAAFERGQIAAMVSTFQGAQSFLASSPAPTGEWLCVFDVNLRYMKPTKPMWSSQDEPPFDALSTYGLDDDPARETKIAQNKSPYNAMNLLISNSMDTTEEAHRPLAGHYANWPPNLPRRLNIFADWLRVVAHEPITAWWASGAKGLHPTLRRGLRHALKQVPNQMSAPVEKFWRLLLDIRFDPQNLGDEEWYDLLSDIRRDGWTQSTIIAFSRVVLPKLTVQRPVYLGSRPPAETALPQFRDLAFFSIEYRANRAEVPQIPDAVLPKFVEVLRNSLMCAAHFLEAIEEKYVRTVTLHEEQLPGQVNLYGANSYFRWFANSFDRLCNLDPVLARYEFSHWPKDEPYFFDKLRIWVFYRHDMISKEEVLSNILGMSKDLLWEINHRREMLWAFRSRWEHFSASEQGEIAQRILEGPLRHADETDQEYLERANPRIASWLGWLKFNSCDLPDYASTAYQSLTAEIDGWQDSWAATEDHSLDGRSGWVRLNDDPSVLSTLPISKIAEATLQIDRRPSLQFVENNPFSGLVKTDTRRAVLALSYEARAGRYSVDLWRTLLAYWPDSVSDRVLWLTAHRLMAVSNDKILSMRYECSRWLHKTFAFLMRQDKLLAWKVWDFLFETLIAGGEQAVESGIGEITIGGIVRQSSRRTVNHAIAGPIGELTATIIDLMIDCSPIKGSGIPDPIRKRFERLLGSPGEGADHVVVLLCERLGWLNKIDGIWTKEHLIPLFQIDGPKAEPAWNGFLSMNTLPPTSLFKTLKKNFLAAFSMADKWIWESSLSRSLSSFLVAALFSGRKANPLVTYEEARNALRATDDEGRVTALWLVERDTNNAIKFFRNVWPKEQRFQTDKTSEAIIRIAINSGDSFPRLVKNITEFLVPIGSLDSELLGLTSNHSHDKNSLYKRFPKETIRLLDVAFDSSSTYIPFDLSRLVSWISEHHPEVWNDIAWIRLNNVIRSV